MFSSIESVVSSRFVEQGTFCDVTDNIDIGGLSETMNSINGLLFNSRIPRRLKHKHIRCSRQIQPNVSHARNKANTPRHQP